MSSLSLKRRIARLEREYGRSTSPLFTVLVPFGTTDQPDGAEAPVFDTFRSIANFAWVRPRRATDLQDRGASCAPGGYLPSVLAEIHAACPWKEKLGICRLCQGTEVASPVPPPKKEES
jgi:hypothetical protein